MLPSGGPRRRILRVNRCVRDQAQERRSSGRPGAHPAAAVLQTHPQRVSADAALQGTWARVAGVALALGTDELNNIFLSLSPGTLSSPRERRRRLLRTSLWTSSARARSAGPSWTSSGALRTTSGCTSGRAGPTPGSARSRTSRLRSVSPWTGWWPPSGRLWNSSKAPSTSSRHFRGGIHMG